MHSWRVTLPFILSAVLLASAARSETAPAPGSLADICPTVDARDTVQSVRAGVAERLGPPVKEETLGTQYILTYRQKDGSRLFVILTRDNDKLEVSCDTAKP